MLALAVLCAAIVLIWIAARFLLAEGVIDPRGIYYFRDAHEALWPMDGRYAADPRCPATADSSTDGDDEQPRPTTQSDGLMCTLVAQLLQGTDPTASDPACTTTGSAKLLRLLSETCCVIPADASKIRILRTPSDFYDELKRKIMTAERRIVMSALYVGDGALSKGLLQALEDRVAALGESARAQRLQNRFGKHCTMSPVASTDSLPADGLDCFVDRFTVDVVLDYNRMHDRKNMMTIRPLAEIASKYKQDVDVRLHLFQTPSSLNRLMGPFGRGKELLGVQHTKLFAFDDEDVILTGANLSDDYFKNRMDRYLVVDSNAQLAAWVGQAVETLVSLSHRVVFAMEDAISADDLAAAEIWPTPSATPQKRQAPFPLNHDAPSPQTHVRRMSSQENFAAASSPNRRHSTTHKKSKLIILPATCSVDATRDQKQFRAVAREQFDRFAATVYEQSLERLQYLLSRSGVEERRSVNTLLFPTLQFGRIGIHQDANVVRRILEAVRPAMRVCLTSPYLNMLPLFTDAVLKSRASFDFITASRTTNGWSGHKGFAGQIPHFYFQLERSFYFLMESNKCTARVRVREFTEPGMTYHAKGMWVLENSCPAPAEGCVEKDDAAMVRLERPVLAAYGSTNYGNRSVHKDVEVEVFLFTWNGDLREQMHLELQRLMLQSEEMTRDRYVGGGMNGGRFQPVVALFASLGQDFL